MYTLDKIRARKGLTAMVLFTLFCLAFAKIYNHFGHGVTSRYLDLAFLIPLIFGVAIYLLLFLLPQSKGIDRISYNLYNSAIVTLVTGSLLQGIMEIAGTRQSLLFIYRIAGIILLLGGVFCFCIRVKRQPIPSARHDALRK